MKPQGKVDIKWSANFAYAIGLIVSDGNLSPSGRHIIFTSKDLEQKEAVRVIQEMYRRKNAVFLQRKRLKINQSLRIVGKSKKSSI